MNAVLLLGAESPAATSLALAYPDQSFVFVSDWPVIDGWDLPNVTMLRGAPAERAGLLARYSQAIVLSPRWLAEPAETSLSTAFRALNHAIPGIAVPLSPCPEGAGRWIGKGDHWHRPDAPPIGKVAELTDVIDPFGCGVVYQPVIPVQAVVMAVGRYAPDGMTVLGLWRVLEERFFRVDVLQAAESVDLPELAELSTAVLAALRFSGWFTLNWLLTECGPRLSSFRPVPKAVFRCFREAGLGSPMSTGALVMVPAGKKLIAWPNYAGFKWLNPP